MKDHKAITLVRHVGGKLGDWMELCDEDARRRLDPARSTLEVWLIPHSFQIKQVENGRFAIFGDDGEFREIAIKPDGTAIMVHGSGLPSDRIPAFI